MSVRGFETEAEAEKEDATVDGEATGSAGSESEESGKAVDFLPLGEAWHERSKPEKRTCPGFSESAELHLRVPEEESQFRKPVS